MSMHVSSCDYLLMCLEDDESFDGSIISWVSNIKSLFTILHAMIVLDTFPHNLYYQCLHDNNVLVAASAVLSKRGTVRLCHHVQPCICLCCSLLCSEILQ